MSDHTTPVPQDTANIPTNGHGRLASLSSNLTLFWRVFVPVFGTVFFTGLLVALWVTTDDDLYLSYPIWWPRVAVSAIWIGWLLYAKTMLWPLKRVDADDAHLYVTNYWVTVRYPWTDVERLDEVKKLGRRFALIQLKAAGRFGQSILFLPGSRYREWMQENKKEDLLGEN
jgi:hypothetical protein